MLLNHSLFYWGVLTDLSMGRLSPAGDPNKLSQNKAMSRGEPGGEAGRRQALLAGALSLGHRAHCCGIGATSPQGASRAFGSHFGLQPGRVPLRAALLILLLLPQRSHLGSGPPAVRGTPEPPGHGRLS